MCSRRIAAQSFCDTPIIVAGHCSGEPMSSSSGADSLTDSTAVFLERCRRAGLPTGHIDRLQDQQLTSLAKLAFAAGQPGETPTDTKLKSLVQIGTAEVPVHVVAALRQVVFEAQTLLISQVKALVERRDDDSKIELAPAERTSRIREQAKGLVGVPLEGATECAHSSYDIVMKVLEENTLTYLPPSKFPSRHSELRQDKPQKTLTISAGSVTVKDQKLDLECETQAPLDLHWAFTRRSLACDLVGLATYDKQQEWHSHLMRHLTSDDPPPGYSKITVRQILQSDRAAWLRMSELTQDGVRRKSDGTLPLDSLFARVMSDPQVMFHLLHQPLSHKRGNDDEGKGSWDAGAKRLRFKGKGEKGGGKVKKGKARVAPRNMPAELQGMNSTTRSGQPICWNYNMKCGCTAAQPGKKCPRGVHMCMKPGCGKTHSLQEHLTSE